MGFRIARKKIEMLPSKLITLHARASGGPQEVTFSPDPAPRPPSSDPILLQQRTPDHQPPTVPSCSSSLPPLLSLLLLLLFLVLAAAFLALLSSSASSFLSFCPLPHGCRKASLFQPCSSAGPAGRQEGREGGIREKDLLQRRGEEEEDLLPRPSYDSDR